MLTKAVYIHRCFTSHGAENETRTRDRDTGTRLTQGESRNGFHVLLICATTQQRSHRNFPRLKSLPIKELSGNLANDAGLSFNRGDCFETFVNNHLITPRAAPRGNLAGKHLVPLTASLLCHWLLSKLKMA